MGQVEKKVIPVVFGVVRSPEQFLTVWCPWCLEVHKHGRGLGHRTAHCHVEASPLNATGYRIRLSYDGMEPSPTLERLYTERVEVLQAQELARREREAARRAAS